MKKWVIIEDRPWVMGNFILEIKGMAAEKGADFSQPDILYYLAGRDKETRAAREKKYQEDIRRFEEQTGITVNPVNCDSFEETVDKYYENKEWVILMDLNLTGQSSEYFHERQNVKYVLRKTKGKEQDRVWFYTTGASLDSGFLQDVFPDNTLFVENFTEGKAQVDMEQAWEILN